MPEHESWCCRSPLSPCAVDGGCSGSCNCGADESLDSLRGGWRMWAHRYDDGLLYNVGSEQFVKYHGLPEPVVEVDVREVPADDPTATHWAWLDSKHDEPIMVWPREGLFEVCFPYGSKVEQDRGKGRVVRLAVTQVRDA